MIKVFISSPYTLGDVAVNVRNQMLISDKLIDLGFAPFTSLYYHFQHMFNPKNYEVWMKLDFELMKLLNIMIIIKDKF